MPLIVQPISQQNQGSAAGVIGYPAIGSLKQYIQISDEFNREVVNPTNAIALYTIAGVGTPSTTITGNNMTVSTDAVINDDNSTRVSGTAFPRISNFIDKRTTITADIIFSFGQTTNFQAFIGLLLSSSTLTGLPTTTRHLGCYINTAVSNNIFLSSANGTSQVTTDVGVAAVSTQNYYRLNIVWSGDDTAVISLYSASGIGGASQFNTLIKSQTVTSVANGGSYYGNYELHFYVQSLQALTAKSLGVAEWVVTAT